MKKLYWLFVVPVFVLGLMLLDTSENIANSPAKAQSQSYDDLPFATLNTPLILIRFSDEIPPNLRDSLTEERILQLDFYNEGVTTSDFKPYALPHKVEAID